MEKWRFNRLGSRPIENLNEFLNKEYKDLNKYPCATGIARGLIQSIKKDFNLK